MIIPHEVIDMNKDKVLVEWKSSVATLPHMEIHYPEMLADWRRRQPSSSARDSACSSSSSSRKGRVIHEENFHFTCQWEPSWEDKFFVRQDLIDHYLQNHGMEVSKDGLRYQEWMLNDLSNSHEPPRLEQKGKWTTEVYEQTWSSVLHSRNTNFSEKLRESSKRLAPAGLQSLLIKVDRDDTLVRVEKQREYHQLLR